MSIKTIMKSSKELRAYVNSHMEGNPLNVEASHIVNVAMAVKKAEQNEVKEYLHKLSVKVIELWRYKNHLDSIPCSKCGR